MSAITLETASSPRVAAASLPIGAVVPSASRLEEEADHSTRLPVLLFFGSAIAWLLIGAALELIASIKLHDPRFLDCFAFTTYGRVWPASVDAMVYGWLTSAGLGLGLGLTARLCRARLVHGGVLIAAWALWNLGLTLGTCAILYGDSTSFEWLEYPKYVSPLLFIAYLFVAISVLLMFSYRRPGHVYLSQWYLIAAFLAFPWLYATANLFLFFLPVQAGAQSPVIWWFVGGLTGLWLLPLALAAAYYLIPKVLGRPIQSYALGQLAFWTVLLFAGWTGLQHLVDGPVPAWMATSGIVAGFLMVVPLAVIMRNLFGTLEGRYDSMNWSPTMRFVIFGLVCFAVVTIEGILLALRSIDPVFHFTQAAGAHTQLGLFGFVSMVLFGAIYYIVPRLTGWEWPSSNLIRAHFWLGAIGAGGLFFDLSVAGVLQGYGLNDAKIPVLAIVDTIEPFFMLRTVFLLLQATGFVCFAASFGLLLARAGGRPLLVTRSAHRNVTLASSSVSHQEVI